MNKPVIRVHGCKNPAVVCRFIGSLAGAYAMSKRLASCEGPPKEKTQ